MDNLKLEFWDYFWIYSIIGISLVIPIFISLKFSRNQNSIKKFFTAGGTIPAWAVGMSILATLISHIQAQLYVIESSLSRLSDKRVAPAACRAVEPSLIKVVSVPAGGMSPTASPSIGGSASPVDRITSVMSSFTPGSMNIFVIMAPSASGIVSTLPFG